MKSFSEMRGNARWAVIGSVALAVAFGLLVWFSQSAADEAIKTRQAFDKSKADTDKAMEDVRRDLFGGRDIYSTTDEMDGTKTYWIAVEATKGDGTLMIRCSSLKDVDASVHFDSIVESNGYGRCDIRLRLDGRRPVREWWGESSNYKAVFAPNPQKLIRD